MDPAEHPAYDPRPLLGEFTSALWFPTYRVLGRGAWSVRVLAMVASRGYWGRTYRTAGSVVLQGPVRGDTATWMSIDPMEIESQEIGIGAARGHTVVLGLGMGWMAANAALHPAVDRVTVVERDPDVIALVEALGVFAQLPPAARAKLEVVAADALHWRPSGPVDILLADIWAKFVEPQKWDDVRRMHDHIRPGALYFWGQEMELWRLACRAAGGPPEMLDTPAVAALMAETGLPLLRPDWPDYGARTTAAARWWTPRTADWWKP